jgi:hypothetical protein
MTIRTVGSLFAGDSWGNRQNLALTAQEAASACFQLILFGLGEQKNLFMTLLKGKEPGRFHAAATEIRS